MERRAESCGGGRVERGLRGLPVMVEHVVRRVAVARARRVLHVGALRYVRARAVRCGLSYVAGRRPASCVLVRVLLRVCFCVCARSHLQCAAAVCALSSEYTCSWKLPAASGPVTRELR
jgi:hypothetical protein